MFADSTWERLLRYVQSAADTEDGIDWNINVDSTVTRAHPHAAGAPQTPPPRAKPFNGGRRWPGWRPSASMMRHGLLEGAVPRAKPSAGHAAD